MIDFGKNSLNFRHNAWVSKKYKYLYMSVPKNACTTVKVELLQLHSCKAPEDISDIHEMGLVLNDFSYEEKLDILTSNWFRFCFIRNPYDRILSAFKSKILCASDNSYTNVRKDILESHDTFSAFLDLVGDQVKHDRADFHWDLQSRILLWDDIKYNYIGKVERFDLDFSTIMGKLTGTKKYPIKAFKHYNRSDKMNNSLFLNNETAPIIYKIYQEDFETLGYKNDSWKNFT